MLFSEKLYKSFGPDDVIKGATFIVGEPPAQADEIGCAKHAPNARIGGVDIDKAIGDPANALLPAERLCHA